MTAKATHSHIKPYAAAMDFKPQPTRASVAAVRMATTACSREERVIPLDYRISETETIPMARTTADVAPVSDAQAIETSALAFIRAVLRREEDEPITEDERATFDRLYLPHAADDPARIDRKSANRTRAAEALETGMPSADILRQQEIFEGYADEREGKSEPMTSMQHTPTTADVGLVLANYMRQTEPAGGDPQVYRDLIGLMLNSPASTPTDALALVSWLSEFLPIAHALLPEDTDETGGPRALLSNACDMAAKAREALELHTGLAAETFIGRSGKAN